MIDEAVCDISEETKDSIIDLINKHEQGDINLLKMCYNRMKIENPHFLADTEEMVESGGGLAKTNGMAILILYFAFSKEAERNNANLPVISKEIIELDQSQCGFVGEVRPRIKVYSGKDMFTKYAKDVLGENLTKEMPGLDSLVRELANLFQYPEGLLNFKARLILKFLDWAVRSAQIRKIVEGDG